MGEAVKFKKVAGATGRIAQVPVGDAMLGRVNALGLHLTAGDIKPRKAFG